MKKSRIEHCKKLNLHVHQKNDQPSTTLRSMQIARLPVDFEHSPEIYQLYHSGTDSEISRGNHAHLLKEEIFQIIDGKCRIKIYDGYQEKIFELNSSDFGLYIPAGVWHEIYFKESAILLVVSSTLYSDDERKTDYIEDIEEFKRLKLSHSSSEQNDLY